MLDARFSKLYFGLSKLKHAVARIACDSGPTCLKFPRSWDRNSQTNVKIPKLKCCEVNNNCRVFRSLEERRVSARGGLRTTESLSTEAGLG